MRIIDGFRLARGNLKRTKLRTFLTLSGVIIGIGAIMLLVSLGVGLRDLSVGRIATINALTRITIVPTENSKAEINDEIINKVKKIPNVEFVSPEIQILTAKATFFETQGEVIVTGIKKKYIDYSDIKITAGTNFSNDSASQVLISKSVLKLFGKENDPDGVIGKEFTIQIFFQEGNKAKFKEINIKTKIIGTTADESLNTVYLPLDLLKNQGIVKYNSLTIKVNTRHNVKFVKAEIQKLGLQVSAVSDLIDQIDQVFFYLQVILGVFGGIALFVAAIGIVNTMTISLLERTHEIGIMKALGAKNWDVMKIFIYESSMLGFFGGLIGISGGWLVGQICNGIIGVLLKMNGQHEKIILFVVPIKFAVFILILSTFLSALAGIYPAIRAAKLSPLQALRFQ